MEEVKKQGMESLFVPYEIALDLKELGFDEVCLAFYNGSFLDSTQYDFDEETSKDIGMCTKVPLYQQAFRWFREKHNLLGAVYSNASGWLWEIHDNIGGTHRGWSEYEGPNDSGVWDTYEEAELACLIKLIEIVKTKQHDNNSKISIS